MRRRLTAALLLLLHALFLTSGPVPAWGTPQRAAVLHTGGLHPAAGRPPAGAGTVRQAHHAARHADLRICAPAHATRQARGEPPRVRAGAGGHGGSGTTVLPPDPAAPRGGTRVTRAGPGDDAPLTPCPRRSAAARAPPSTAY